MSVVEIAVAEKILPKYRTEKWLQNTNYYIYRPYWIDTSSLKFVMARNEVKIQTNDKEKL